MIENPIYKEAKARNIAFWNGLFGQVRPGINWRGPNAWTWAFFLVSLLLSLTTRREVYFGLIEHDHLVGLVAVLYSYFVRRVIESYTSAMDRFTPIDVTAAKRANEQIKLFATFLNSCAVGIVGVVSIRELFLHETPNAEPNYTLMVASFGVALYIHAHARGVLNYIKSEVFP